METVGHIKTKTVFAEMIILAKPKTLIQLWDIKLLSDRVEHVKKKRGDK